MLFFDGVCGLCNSLVDFALKRDHKQRLLFSPLQSAYATQELGEKLTQNLSTVVLLEIDSQGRRRLSLRSQAVLRLLSHLGGIYRLAVLGWLIPRPIRDWMYGIAANRRYRWFGKKDSCRIPTPAERARFLIE